MGVVAAAIAGGALFLLVERVTGARLPPPPHPEVVDVGPKPRPANVLAVVKRLAEDGDCDGARRLLWKLADRFGADEAQRLVDECTEEALAEGHLKGAKSFFDEQHYRDARRELFLV